MSLYTVFNSSIFDDPTFEEYSPLQKWIVVYYYFSNKKKFSSGFTTLDPTERFRFPIDNRPISRQKFLELLNSVSEFILLDSDNSVIFLTKYFKYSGSKFGSPALVKKSIENSMKKFSDSINLWQYFLKLYPTFKQSFDKVSSTFNQRFNSNSVTSSYPMTYNDFLKKIKKEKKLKGLERFEKPFANLSFLFPFPFPYYSLLVLLFNTHYIHSIIINYNNESNSMQQSIKTFFQRLFEFFELREQLKSPFSVKNLPAFLSRLKSLSGGSVEKCVKILEYSLSGNYKSIFDIANSDKDIQPAPDKVSLKTPANLQTLSENLNTPLAMLLNIFKVSSLSHDIKNLPIEEIKTKFADRVFTFYEKKANPPISSFQILLNFGIADYSACSQILTFLDFPADNKLKNIISDYEPKNLLKSLVFGKSKTKKYPHPLLDKASQSGLTENEMKNLPFKYRDLLIKKDKKFVLKNIS